jgi:hypothetical protein
MECGFLYLTIFYPTKTHNVGEVQLHAKDPFHMVSKTYALYLLWHSYDASHCGILCQLDVQYLHPHAAIDSSIGLNPAPQLELSAAIGSKDISMGAEAGFDTTSASFSKYNAGIAFNKPDFSATLML